MRLIDGKREVEPRVKKLNAFRCERETKSNYHAFELLVKFSSCFSSFRSPCLCSFLSSVCNVVLNEKSTVFEIIQGMERRKCLRDEDRDNDGLHKPARREFMTLATRCRLFAHFYALFSASCPASVKERSRQRRKEDGSLGGERDAQIKQCEP